MPQANILLLDSCPTALCHMNLTDKFSHLHPIHELESCDDIIYGEPTGEGSRRIELSSS